MSHPIPTLDYEATTEDKMWYSASDKKWHTDGFGIFDHEGDARKAIWQAQDEEQDRAREIYDAIIILKYAKDDELKEIALGLTNEVKERLVRILQD